MIVRLNKTARTNKLETITTPLGAEYVLDYKHVASTYDKPGGKWVYSDLEVKDLAVPASNLSIEGFANTFKEFDYHNANYDRRERMDFGYEYVRTIDRETAGDKSTPVYRQQVQRFNNESFYLQGNLTEEYMVKGEVSIVEPTTLTGKPVSYTHLTLPTKA